MTNPLLNILDGKYNEVTKNLTMTNHMYTPQIVIVGKRTWDKLSPADQKILRDAAVETTAFQRKVARDEAAKVLDLAKKAGMTVHELPPAEIDKLREVAKPVIAKHTKTVGEEMVNEVNAELAEAARGQEVRARRNAKAAHAARARGHGLATARPQLSGNRRAPFADRLHHPLAPPPHLPQARGAESGRGARPHRGVAGHGACVAVTVLHGTRCPSGFAGSRSTSSRWSTSGSPTTR